MAKAKTWFGDCWANHTQRIGLPAKFLMDEKEEKEKCSYCHEKVMFCALARTRAQAKMEKEEDEKDSDPNNGGTMNDDTNAKSINGKESLVDWLSNLKANLSLGDGNNLIDHNYEFKTALILTKANYLKWTSKFFSLEQIF